MLRKHPQPQGPLTSTRRPILAMCGEQSLTVSSFSICKSQKHSSSQREPGAPQEWVPLPPALPPPRFARNLLLLLASPDMLREVQGHSPSGGPKHKMIYVLGQKEPSEQKHRVPVSRGQSCAAALCVADTLSSLWQGGQRWPSSAGTDAARAKQGRGAQCTFTPPLKGRQVQAG